MKNKQAGFASSGVVALAILAAIFGLTAVMARYFSKGTGVFEQWYLRYSVSFLFTLLIFWKSISLRKFLKLSQREWLIVIFRAILGSVAAVAIYTLAAQKAKVGPVAFMQVLPTTALLGVFLLHEKISIAKIALITLSFLGAAIVVVPSVHDISGFNLGELLSFISGACFSLQFVTRKWHTSELNNQEITLAMVGIGMVLNYALSLLVYHRAFATGADWSIKYTILLVAAGMLSAVMIFLVSYGFEHVSAVVASTILDLEQIFGVIFGYVFYRETLSSREVIGGLVILVAVVLMNQVNNRETLELKAVPNLD